MTAGDPLLVSADDPLVSAVLRLAAAAGVAVEVVTDAAAAMRSWGTAAAVLVGADQAPATAACGPPRRDQVHLLSVDAAPDRLFRTGVDLGAASVLELPAAEAWLVELLADLADGSRRTAITVGVVGGSGGVGSTVLAVALAAVAATAGKALLVDLDPLGPGLGRLVGIDHAAGITWSELAGLHGRLGSRSLRESLPERDGIAVLGWSDAVPARPEAALVREVIAAGSRGHDWVVLDLPRSSDQDTVALAQRCDHVLLVVGSTLPAVASATRTAERLRSHTSSLGAVVRARRTAVPAADVARAVRAPLLAELAEQRRLDEHLDLGLGPVHNPRGPLAVTAAQLLRRLGSDR
jgi:secretion/DNA translocation related CpaE-like protein